MDCGCAKQNYFLPLEPDLRIQFWEVKVRVSLVGSYTSSSLPALFHSLVLIVAAVFSNGLSCTVPSCCSPYCQFSSSSHFVRKLTFFLSQPAFARAIQTSADTTQLQDTIQDYSQPFTVKLHEESFRSYQCETPSLEVEVKKDELLKMYKDMQTMRRMEMAADALYKAKLIRGFCHLAIGQVCRILS